MTSQFPVWLLSAMVVCLAALFAWLLGRILRIAPVYPASRSESRRPLNLRPMERLLRDDDFSYLASLPGYTPEVGQRLRARRVEVFRGYLSQVEAEFHRLHLALRLIGLTSGQDRPDLARLLLEQRVVFSYRMFQVRLRLLFFGFGIRPLATGDIVRTVEVLREQIATLQPAIASAPAA